MIWLMNNHRNVKHPCQSCFNVKRCNNGKHELSYYCVYGNKHEWQFDTRWRLDFRCKVVNTFNLLLYQAHLPAPLYHSRTIVYLSSQIEQIDLILLLSMILWATCCILIYLLVKNFCFLFPLILKTFSNVL